MARRFRRKPFSPDRGWIVDGFKSSASNDGNAIMPVAINLFQFSDINSEALSGAIAQDKSDWFLKRLIVDVTLSFGSVGGTVTDTARLVEFGVAILNDENTNEIVGNRYRPISDEYYDLCARTLQTWEMPCYLFGSIPYDGDVLGVANPSTASDYSISAPFWGPARMTLDIDVSNAGLRPNQSCEMFICQVPGPGSFNWDASDTLNYNVMYKALLQKRRV